MAANGESSAGKLVIGLFVTVVGGLILAYLGNALWINRRTTVTIDGPSRARIGEIVPLRGVVRGDYDEAYWSNSRGWRRPFMGDQLTANYQCPGFGRYSITLTVVNDHESIQAKQEIDCM